MGTPTSAAHKRSRSLSSSSASSSGSVEVSEPEPTLKSLRADSQNDSTFTCSLAPTCNSTPSVHSSASALSSHYATYHSYTCTAPALLPSPPNSKNPCNRLFPTAHLLSLHLSEHHSALNPLLPTPFACLQPSCTQRFKSPKGRRLHAIEKHAYPKEWFFGVTQWGIEGVLSKGGGMVRREWKPRPAKTVANAEHEAVAQEERTRRGSSTKVGDGEDGVKAPGMGNGRRKSVRSDEDEFEQRDWSSPPTVEMDQDDPIQGAQQLVSIIQPPKDDSQPPAKTKDSSMDDLTQALSGVSLTMVPRSVTKARAKAKAAAAMDRGE